MTEKKSYSFAPGWKTIIVFLIIAAAGCSHVWRPGRAPEISLETVGKLDGSYSVALINDQPDTKLQVFGGGGGHTHWADYNEWTNFFIKTFTVELEKRGVTVSDSSPNKIHIKLSDFLFIQGFAKLRTNMKVRLYSSDGSWSKELNETDTSGWSIGRAFGSLVYHTIEKLLQDPEIIGRMKTS